MGFFDYRHENHHSRPAGGQLRCVAAVGVDVKVLPEVGTFFA
jgi:hypothetical protein